MGRSILRTHKQPSALFRLGPEPLHPPGPWLQDRDIVNPALQAYGSALDQPCLRDWLGRLGPSIRLAISAAWVATVLLLNTFA